MPLLDLLIIAAYVVVMLGIGFYFMRRNADADDYYVAGRKMGAWHIGLSVVATDVGGGFSIGLGGLGFAIGLSGSWMLFTGLIGAWSSAVLLVPRVARLGRDNRFTTLPEFFGHFYGPRVAALAGLISAIGYLGFTASQVLAGAKLAAASFDGIGHLTALLLMGVIVVVYTVMGGLNAVIYTDTIQWAILLVGLCGVAIPLSYLDIGGLGVMRETLPPRFFSLANISWQQAVNWGVTIIPIWYVAMTLYQRVYACRDATQAKRAWLIAGLFEWPVMAFMGVLLGLMARVAAEQGLLVDLGFTDAAQLDPEQGLPLLLREMLPVGLKGLMVAAYFSAIMSTADSCLVAASGNVVTDLLGRLRGLAPTVRGSQLATLGLGALALLLAGAMGNVLQLMLYSYAFMVSGLFVPAVAALATSGERGPRGAFWAMLIGGTLTSVLGAWQAAGGGSLPWQLDANVFGLAASAAVLLASSRLDSGLSR